MLKKKNNNKQNYRSELTKLELFQNQTTLHVCVAWTNPINTICKQINDHHYCFCGHFLSQHISTHENSIDKCTVERCICQHFQFVSSLNLKCICKHTPFRHQMSSKKCSQCFNCIGFVTEWLCECGYRFEQHTTKVEAHKETEKRDEIIEKRNKSKLLEECRQNLLAASLRLSRVTSKREINYSKNDKVKESPIVNLVRAKVYNSLPQYIDSNENEHELGLKHKLRQANLRYFARFKGLTTLTAETQHVRQDQHQINALDLYIQPHNFRSFRLSKHIPNILAHRYQ